MLTNFTVVGSLGRPSPDRGLEVNVSGKCFQSGRSRYGLLLGTDGDCSFAGRVISSRLFAKSMAFQNESAVMEADRDLYGALFVPLTGEAVSFIEEHRRGGDLELNLRLRIQWQEVAVEQPNTSNASYQAGLVRWNDRSLSVRLGQSDWLQRLTQMEWEEWRLFELPVQPLVADEKLARAISHLLEAQKLLQQGNYDACMAECRLAFESAAQYHTAGDSKQGYDLLLARAFTADSEKVKVDRLRELMLALDRYIHPLGRHAQAPAVHVGRPEAEFVLATTVSLLSMLSRRIGEEEKRR